MGKVYYTKKKAAASVHGSLQLFYSTRAYAHVSTRDSSLLQIRPSNFGKC